MVCSRENFTFTCKQFSILQYEEVCVAGYRYDSEIYESTIGPTCGQEREGTRNEENWTHGKQRRK
jgi:hypothetical protein